MKLTNTFFLCLLLATSSLPASAATVTASSTSSATSSGLPAALTPPPFFSQSHVLIPPYIQQPQAPKYDIVLINALNPVTNSVSDATAINNLGEVTGSSTGPIQPCAFGTCYTLKTFFWRNNQTQVVPSPDPTDLTVSPLDMNDSQEIVGFSIADFVPNAYFKAFSSKNGVTTKLPHLNSTPTKPGSIAMGINNLGKIVGMSADSLKNMQPVIWANGAVQSLGTLPGDNTGSALSINNSNVAVGWSGNGTTTRAVKWDQNGNIVDISDPQMINSVATGINDNGMIMGEAYFVGAPTQRRAIMWDSNGQYVYLTKDAAGETMDINNHGQIVGTVATTSGKYTAYIWENGKSHDLNYLIPANSGWYLSRAASINDRGQIAGFGFYNGTNRAFVLTPKP